MIRKKCKYCGGYFMSKSARIRYCSKACRIEAAEERQSRKRQSCEKRCKGQLCWTCKNANGNDCSWFSKEAEPVEGWTAKPTIIKNNDGIMKSYRITKCPKYEQGRKR